MTARLVAMIVSGLAAVALSGYLAWFAITGLLDRPDDAWFYVVALAVVPLTWAMAAQVPDLIAARSSEERTTALFARFPSICWSLSSVGLVAAVAVAIGSWSWGAVLVACGVVLAVDHEITMGTVRRAFERDPDEPRPKEPPMSPLQVALFVARVIVFVATLTIVLGSVGYILLGRHGALVAVGLLAVVVLWGGVSMARAVRRSDAGVVG